MLKIRINKNGYLSIKRKEVIKYQLCCLQPQSATNVVKCGDWCPLFGEPEDIRGKNMRDQRVIGQSLQLCWAKLIGRVVDNRESEPVE